MWSVIPPEMKDLTTLENLKRKLKSCGKKLNLVQFDKGQAATTLTDSRYKYFSNERTQTLYLFCFP